MNYSETLPPKGTVREGLDYHAEKTPNGICYLFSDGAEDLNWLTLRN